MKPKALDLFCCAGGASVGLLDAGFDVTGVDIRPQPDYPHSLYFPIRFMQADALGVDLSGYDFIWASPPCQAYSALRHLHPERQYVDLISETRAKLRAWGGPYVIENVTGAPLIDPVMLCGSSFGLRVRRHRMFESNISLRALPCNHAAQGRPIDVSGTGGRRVNRRLDDHGGNTNKPLNLRQAREAIGIDWTSRWEISQAIPPAYSEFIGRQVLQYLAEPSLEPLNTSAGRQMVQHKSLLEVPDATRTNSVCNDVEPLDSAGGNKNE